MKQAGTGIFLAFLMTAAWQDLQRQSIEVRVYKGFALAAAAWNLIMLFWGAEGADTVAEPLLTVGVVCCRRVLSCSIGFLLLLLGWASRNQVGAGDGCFFVVSGLLLDARENFWLFVVSMLLCGIWSLGVLVRAQAMGGGNAGKYSLPFLPFVAAAGAMGMAAGVIGI